MNDKTRDLLELDYMEWLEQELTNRYEPVYNELKEEAKQ